MAKRQLQTWPAVSGEVSRKTLAAVIEGLEEMMNEGEVVAL